MSAAAESSILLSGMLPSVTTAANLVADKTIEFLRQQQEQLQRQLLRQEILNTNLYQSLIDSGVIPSFRTTTTSSSVAAATSASNQLLDLLKNRSLLSGLAKTTGSGSGTGDASSSSAAAGGSGASAVATSAFNSVPNLANLATILPLSEAFTSLGTIFDKLFGTKFWIYILLALLIGTAFTIISCFFMYCCCCNRLGKALCCCRFGGGGSGNGWFSSRSGGHGNKKSRKKQSIDDSPSKIKCCV